MIGNAVQVFRWICGVDQSYAREVIDSRVLNQNLSILFKSGGYNIAQERETKRWMIPYVLRKKVEENG